MFPLIALGLLVVYAIAKQSERSAEHASGDAAPSDPATGGGTNLGLEGDADPQSLLAKILSGGQVRGPREGTPVQAAAWYAPDAEGFLVATPFGRSQLNMLFAGYSHVEDWNRSYRGGFSHQAWPSSYARGLDYPLLSVYVNRLQAAGGHVFMSKEDIDALADRKQPNPLDYLSTSDPSEWRAKPPTSAPLVMLG